ncbi:MAG: hypothetical protein WKG07_35070 [Hymenobacter sp.]
MLVSKQPLPKALVRCPGGPTPRAARGLEAHVRFLADDRLREPPARHAPATSWPWTTR